MELRSLGKTGLTVSGLGFGCGAVGGLMVRGEATEQRRAVARAIEAGIRYFDTAPSYGDGRSEENLGRVLSDLDLDPDARDIVIGTKFRVDPQIADDPAAVGKAIRESLDASLRRLGREKVQLFQLHNKIGPEAGAITPEQVLGPVVDTLHQLRDAGTIEHFGFTATGDPASVRRIVESNRLETGQVYFNALNPSAGYAGRGGLAGTDFDGLIDVAAHHDVGVIVIRSLAGGAVAASDVRHANASSMGSGNVAGERYADDLARAQALSALAIDLELDGPVELAFRFALAKSGVSTVIVGFSDESQLEDALRWASRSALPTDAVQAVLDSHS